MTKARDKANSTVTNFASTGIDDNADANAITIDSSENVLVGKTSEDATTVGATMRPNGGIVSVRDGDTNVVLNRKTSDGTIIDLRKDNTTVGAIEINSNRLLMRSTGDASGLRFDGSAYTPFKNGSTANGTVDLGFSAGRFKDLYLSGSAYIGGTAAANALDDYEEGSWTGTLTGAVAPSSSQTATGSYTKIGRLVTVNISFSAKDTSGASGALEVRGLPFSISDQGWGSYLSYQTANTSSGSIEAVAWANSGTKIIFYDWADSAPWNTTLITAGSDRYLFVSLTYATT